MYLCLILEISDLAQYLIKVVCTYWGLNECILPLQEFAERPACFLIKLNKLRTVKQRHLKLQFVECSELSLWCSNR